MDKAPIASSGGHNAYGSANPGFMPPAYNPAMYAPPVPVSADMNAPPAAALTAPSAPPASMFDPVPGYETLAGGGGGFVPPPMPANLVPQPEPGHTPQQWNIPSISEDTARKAFSLFASSHCCYSKSPAKDGVITKMEAFNTYRFCLETFTEARSTAWSQEPYHGQQVDANMQNPPGPWDIAANSPQFFHDDTQVIQVPYTSSVKNCYACMGMGRMPCRHCAGAGTKFCNPCQGYGFSRPGNDRCNFCQGRGRGTCSFCFGRGTKECKTCRGARQLLVFINLTVTWRAVGSSETVLHAHHRWGIQWKNNKDDYMVEQSSGLKDENLKQVSGKEMFTDTQYLVYPVMGFPDPEVVRAAERLVSEHQGKFSRTGRVLQQRQTIELIPITKVTYSWKGSPHVYYVYGNEVRVSADDYPATCCCTVM